MIRNTVLTLTDKEAEMLLASADQMHDDAEEHYGKQRAAAYYRAMQKLREALWMARRGEHAA